MVSSPTHQWASLSHSRFGRAWPCPRPRPRRHDHALWQGAKLVPRTGRGIVRNLHQRIMPQPVEVDGMCSPVSRVPGIGIRRISVVRPIAHIDPRETIPAPAGAVWPDVAAIKIDLTRTLGTAADAHGAHTAGHVASHATSMVRGLACSTFGSVSERTPSFSSAAILF